MIIDHIGLAVSDYEKQAILRRRALAPLGIAVVMEVEGWAGLGRAAKPEFGSASTPRRNARCTSPSPPKTAPRCAPFRRTAAGARDNGAPASARSPPSYYGAFVIGRTATTSKPCHAAESE